MKNKKILILAAHPDDEMMGCGGTVKKLIPENQARVVILGEGMMSRTGAAESQIETLQAHSREANRILGLGDLHFERLPDNRFDTVALLEIAKRVEKHVEEFKPDVIFTHHYGDLNIDHRLTLQAALTATRPLPQKKKVNIFAFETPSATEWQVQADGYVFKPNLFMDITDTIEHKLAALQKYVTEIRPFPHSRSVEGIRTMAKDWGRKIGVEYAEAFEVIKMYGLESL